MEKIEPQWKWFVCEVTSVKRSTHCDPVDCSLPVSSFHRILQARLSEWVAMSSTGSSQIQGSNSCLLGLLHWPVGSLPRALPPRKPENSLISPQNINYIFSIWPSSSTLDTSLENWNKNISMQELLHKCL